MRETPEVLTTRMTVREAALVECVALAEGRTKSAVIRSLVPLLRDRLARIADRASES